MEFAVQANARHKAEGTDGGRTSRDTEEFTHWYHTQPQEHQKSFTSAQGATRAQREGRQHKQITGGANPHNSRTYLHPLAVDFHEEDAERVGFGGDIPVQKVLAADGQLDFADTVLGADGPRRCGSCSVGHGLRWQQLQALCATGHGQISVLGGTKRSVSPAELGTHSVPQAEAPALTYRRDLSHEAFLAPSPGVLSGSPAEHP